MKRMFVSERVRITGKFSPDFEVAKHVHSYTQDIKKKLDLVAGCSGVDLEARFSRVRTTETNLGNMLADLIRTQLNTDIGLTNGGGLRANQVIPAGPIQYRLLNQILPQTDRVVKLKVRGDLLKRVLENSVSAYPKMDGRWPCTSGIKFQFDPERPAGDRIIPGSMLDGDGKPFDFGRVYSVGITNYMGQGKDGFEAFLDPSVQRCNHSGDEELDIRELVNDFFRSFLRTEEEEAVSPGPSRRVMSRRMRLFSASLEVRCPASGAIVISPVVDGRVVNIRPPLEYTD